MKIILLLALALAGCATRSTVVIDSESDMLMLMKPVKAPSVGVYRDGKWVESGPAVLPAGMVVGPEPKP